MFLPERVGFQFEGLPDLGKREISVLSALLGCLVWCPGRLVRARPGRGLESLVFALIAANFVTAATNRSWLFYGPKTLQGLTTWDAISETGADVLTFGLPFFLGRALFWSRSDLIDLMKVLAIAGLVYAPLVLFEIRMSPMLNVWVYGFHQHSWAQVHRFGGFRPLVFMHHGLALSVFVLITAIAATTLARIRQPLLGFPSGVPAGFLAILLLLCRSLGSIAYGIAVLPLVAFAKPRWQLRAAVALSLCVLLYPAMRTAKVFPTERILTAASWISPERAASLETRFQSEDLLAEKAAQRIGFGWGPKGRNIVYDDRGRGTVITDGFWIIILGQKGLVGFYLTFGLLLLPVFLARNRLSRIAKREDRLLVSGLALLAVVYVVDLVPNGLFTSLPFFFAGTLTSGAVLLGAGRGSLDRRDSPARRLRIRDSPGGRGS